MSRGQHAADDGSFPRSAGGAMLRGVGLILVAVILGVVLLNATDSPEPFRASSTAEDDDGTVDPAEGDDDDTTTSSTEPPPEPHNPAEVAVLVANGTGGQVSGAAGRIAERLKPENYILKPSTNATAAAEASMVYYQPEYEADARAIAGIFTPAPGVQPMPEQPPVADLQGAHILVVVAADLAARS